MIISPVLPATKTARKTAPAASVVLELVNATEPDEPVRFTEDGRSVLFGRDDTVCDVVVWSAINGRELSRVAGRIWRMDDRLWVQNLSRQHDLLIAAGAVESLPPAEPGGGTGPGRSLPWGASTVLGPGGCELHARQSRIGARAGGGDTQTDGLPPVPTGLLPVALALCEPMLGGARVPATYRQVSERAGLDSYKRARSLVAELCALYLPLGQQAPAGEAAARPTGRAGGGVWRFAPHVHSAEPSTGLRIPDYVVVAQLLVRRHVVRREMLTLLDGPCRVRPRARRRGPRPDGLLRS